MRYTSNQATILPLPFRRGEGRGEGSVPSLKQDVETLHEPSDRSESNGLLSLTLSSRGGEGSLRIVRPTAHRP
jgi:hypothetical protein